MKAMVSLRQVEAFHAIVEAGSFAAAATALGTTQPAISKRIVELEADLGFPLFDRSARPPQLTRHGHALLPLCAEMLALRTRMRATLDDPAEYAGQFRIGITELVALTVLPALIGRIRARLPHIRLRTEVKLAEDLHQDLLDRRSDMAIAPGPPPGGLLHARKVASLELAWMAGASLGPLPPGPLPAAALARFPLLAQTQRSGLQAVVNEWLLENGQRPQLILACNSLTALSGMTIAGLGIALMPRTQFLPKVASGQLRIIETTPPMPRLDYHVLYPASGLEAVAGIVAEEVAAVGPGLG
ncbi:LysR family transcriptional regulator [Roseomonas sp. USHLN139]|uniref:LysR family transcriptional regulator n=1 Tax=Roseomonas sp. USHLN139 TaxID=3081298 RepID=UPI003B02BA17